MSGIAVSSGPTATDDLVERLNMSAVALVAELEAENARLIGWGKSCLAENARLIGWGKSCFDARLQEGQRADKAEAERRLALIMLDHCRTILSNLARENEGAIFDRWPIKAEPLRADAKRLLPELAELLGVEYD